MMTKDSDNKSQYVNGIEYRYSSDWITRLEGVDHWLAYWQQLNISLPSIKKGDTVLEIGPGTGFVSNYLKQKGYAVTTLDIDSKKSPDIIANIVTYEFPEQFDHILAFEVFEHIPYDEFLKIIVKLRASCRKLLIISLPLNHKVWFRADLIVPYLKKVSFAISTKRRRIIEDHHFWELNYRGFTVKKLIKVMADVGFSTEHVKRNRTTVFFKFCSK